tara:strand:+ start:492 stop:914 length:423 start_codon:yes stop_codon:yes gene_type:complete
MYGAIIDLGNFSVKKSEQLLKQVKEEYDTSMIMHDSMQGPHYDIGCFPFQHYPFQANLTLYWGGDDYGEYIENAEMKFVGYKDCVLLTLTSKNEGVVDSLEKTVRNIQEEPSLPTDWNDESQVKEYRDKWDEMYPLVARE